MKRKSDRPANHLNSKNANVTLLSAVLLLAARSLILMSLPPINRTKLYFRGCFFSLFSGSFYDFWFNFLKIVTFSEKKRLLVTF